jgi:transposase
MAMGKRRKAKQKAFWVEARHLEAHSNPFYEKVNEILEKAHFDGYVERLCRKYYHPQMGRPSIAPGVYFRCFLVGYLEGIDSERGIAYRVADSLSLRQFLGLSWEERTPDHSTLSKTRRMMNLGTHRAVFQWTLKQLARQGLFQGKNLGIDATTLEANAALKSIVRRDSGESYDEHVAQLMKVEGIEEPTVAERQRWDRKRKKSLSNRDWVNPHDREARITKMKDGRTHLAYKAEQVVDLDTDAMVSVTVQPADRGDTESMRETLGEAGREVTTLAGRKAQPEAVGLCPGVSETGVERVVGDKGYHSKDSLRALAEMGVKTVIGEPERGRQSWEGQQVERQAVCANRRRTKSKLGKALLRRRGEFLERAGAHLYDTGGMRRVHLRGRKNIAKRLLIHAAAFNLGLILRHMLGAGTARQAADLLRAICLSILRLLAGRSCSGADKGPILPPVAPPVTAGDQAPQRCFHHSLSTGC